MNALTLIPASVRKYVYAAYAVAVVIIGGLDVAHVGLGHTHDVLAYIGGVLGVTAASNVTPDVTSLAPAVGDIPPVDPAEPASVPLAVAPIPVVAPDPATPPGAVG